MVISLQVPGKSDEEAWGELQPGLLKAILPENFQSGGELGEEPYAYVNEYETPSVAENGNYDIESASKKTLHDQEDASDDQSNKVYGYDRFVYTNEPEVGSNVAESKRTDTDFQGQRVQVTTEETGSQRVQVNNGFQEEFVPGLNPESGRISSGVLLEWKLTFYGTGPEDSVSGDYGDDDDNDVSSDADLEL